MRYVVEPIKLDKDHPAFPDLMGYKIRDLKDNYLMKSIYIDQTDCGVVCQRLNDEEGEYDVLR